MKTKACIFDLDGTLVNSLTDLAMSCNLALETLGLPTHEVGEYRFFVGRGVVKLIESILPENDRTPEMMEKALALFNQNYSELYLENTQPYEDIPELLLKLRSLGYKLAVVSNKPDRFTQQLISELFLDEFDFVTGQREGVPRKPNPAAVHAACLSMGADPKDCLYLGDSGVDMLTATAAGCFAVGVLWGFREKTELIENGAQATIAIPLDLLTLIH